MTLIPRKRCPKCSTVFEGPEVANLHSCDVCGNGHVNELTPVDPERQHNQPLPRGGGQTTITHTRENW